MAMSTKFGALKRVDAGPLSVGYAEAGPADGLAVLLLHGWPYDIHSFAEVTAMLASAGYRVIVPFARGYGTTSFLSRSLVRNGQQAVLAVDVIELMDALGIGRAILGGFDWGGRSADIIAALWPDRCRALVSVSGYLIGSQAAGAVPLPPPAEHIWGTSSTLPQTAAGPATTNTGASSTSSSGSSPRRGGPSTTLRTRVPRPPSTTPITSRS
jgi:pimeloyl-ACP methyl ester carboxylesterase